MSIMLYSLTLVLNPVQILSIYFFNFQPIKLSIGVCIIGSTFKNLIAGISSPAFLLSIFTHFIHRYLVSTSESLKYSIASL